MARTAARDVRFERVTTAPMRQPRSRKHLPECFAYASCADDGNRASHSQRDSITCSISSPEEIARCTSFWTGTSRSGRSSLDRGSDRNRARCSFDAVSRRFRSLARSRNARPFPFWWRPATKPRSFPTRSQRFWRWIIRATKWSPWTTAPRTPPERFCKTPRCKDSRLKCVRVDSLPAGWLGKPHALQQAYETFDRRMAGFHRCGRALRAATCLRRAVALAQQKGWDHLTLLGTPKMFGFWRKDRDDVFRLGFLMGIRPWRVSDPRSRVYTGVGAFQLIRRSTYEKMGTHRRLAMEVVDDMKLGKLVKEAGIPSGVARAGDAVSVHWHAGVRNMIRGTTKNFFATTGFRCGIVARRFSGCCLMFVFPVVALPFAHGWARRVRSRRDWTAGDRDGRRVPRIRSFAALRADVSRSAR